MCIVCHPIYVDTLFTDYEIIICLDELVTSLAHYFKI